MAGPSSAKDQSAPQEELLHPNPKAHPSSKGIMWVTSLEEEEGMASIDEGTEASHCNHEGRPDEESFG